MRACRYSYALRTYFVSVGRKYPPPYLATNNIKKSYRTLGMPWFEIWDGAAGGDISKSITLSMFGRRILT